jgi:hypothetical protein
MALSRLANDVLDFEFLSLAGIQRTDALIYFGPKTSQLYDVLEQLLADFLLICLRQTSDFSYCSFKDLCCHGHTI